MSVFSGISDAYRLFRDGGILITTGECEDGSGGQENGTVLIKTLFQPDGDVITMLSRDALEKVAAVKEAHDRKVSAQIERLRDFGLLFKWLPAAGILPFVYFFRGLTGELDLLPVIITVALSVLLFLSKVLIIKIFRNKIKRVIAIKVL